MQKEGSIKMKGASVLHKKYNSFLVEVVYYNTSSSSCIIIIIREILKCWYIKI